MEKPELASEFRVSSYFDSAGTRERGRGLYPDIREWTRREEGDLVVTFEGVKFVSLSFLDETILRVLREQREDLEGRLSVRGLHPLAAERLRARLTKAGLSPAIVLGERASEYA